MTDPMNEVETRTDPDYTSATALTGSTTLAGVVQRFDNAMQQIEGMERQIQAQIGALASAVGANHTAEAAQLAGLLVAIQQQTATVSDDQINAIVTGINANVGAETALLIGQKLVASS